MRFIDRLFPFLNNDSFNENLLTSLWIIVLLVIFIGSVSYLLYTLYSLRKKINKGSFKKDKRLKEIWQGYRSTFSEYGGKDKTAEHADEYFNEHNVLFAYMNFRVINNISNIIQSKDILYLLKG